MTDRESTYRQKLRVWIDRSGERSHAIAPVWCPDKHMEGGVAVCPRTDSSAALAAATVTGGGASGRSTCPGSASARRAALLYRRMTLPGSSMTAIGTASGAGLRSVTLIASADPET